MLVFLVKMVPLDDFHQTTVLICCEVGGEPPFYWVSGSIYLSLVIECRCSSLTSVLEAFLVGNCSQVF